VTELLHGRDAGERPDFRREYVELLRIVLLSGLLVGLFVAGPALRLSMLLLRLTSPDTVIGIQSDDDFTIGEFTLGGTYNLFMLGAALGVLGAAVYVLVSPWLIGPRWFHAFTFAFTAGVYVGSLVIKDEGIDFHALKPTWLAIALFIAVPAIVGAVLPRVADAVATRGPSSRSWLALGVLQLVFFPSAVMSVIVAIVMVPGLALRRTLLEPIQRSQVAMWLFRAAFMFFPVAGTLMLAQDIRALM
jgi:hypothetical protein